MARPPSHSLARSSPSHSYYDPLAAAAPAFRAVVALLVVAFRVLVVLALPQSVLSAAGAASHNHSAASGITAAMNWLAHRPRRELSLGPSHGSRGATERRMSLLERAASSRSLTLLADRQLRALEALNAAWQLWPSNSNRSRRCDQWEYIQCNAQGFITAVVLPDVGIDATMPLNVFSSMPYLRRLVLGGNYNLNGTISDLPLPPSLRMLDLSDTSVSGSLPSSILSLSALAHLDIYYTSLSGSLPSNLNRLSRLTYLNIGAPGITGRLEDFSWLSTLTNLRSLVLNYMYSMSGDLSSLTFLTTLRAMQHLTIANNIDWAGELPVSLGTLTSLTHLDLRRLTSTQFPRWVMDLTALRYLDVYHDSEYRTGVVPQDLYRLSQLQHFDASGNGLVGSLPEYWTALNHLTFLSLAMNKIEGSIPSTLSALTSLSTLDLGSNSLDGTIPRVFSTTLSSLNLDDNAFSGPVPSFIGSLDGLTWMSLRINNFTGAIPESLTGLTNLPKLRLSGNQLTSGLDVVERMTWLESLEISYNMYAGSVPSLLSFPLLNFLSLSGNSFQGSFPAALLKLTNLMALDVGHNQLHGSIPEDISKLQNMAYLSLDNNNFHGDIPLSLFTITGISDLYLSDNRLGGSLPSPLVTGSLSTLQLQGNGFSGPLPDFTLWNTSLVYLLLQDNNFTGPIPQSISTMTSLNMISLANNQLSGTVPASLTTLTNLAAIDLAGNSISGPLPTGLGNLFNLITLSLYDNQLTGVLPPSMCNLTKLERLFLRNNHFYGNFPSCFFEYCLHKIDISNNSFYGPINSNFRSMIPDNGALLNIAGNFFYGDPMLYADGCQFCPSGVIQPLVLTPADLIYTSGGRCVPGGAGGYVEMTRAGANKKGEASLRRNCFTLSKQMECTANETQRSSDECLAFCSMSRELGPCDGHGACVPPQAGAAEARFTCECDDGFVPTNGSLGSTCARPAPPPAAALSTGAVVGIAVGSAAAFALLLALIVALLWPRKRRRWSDLDVCQEFSMGEILRATDNWASSNVLGKGGFATVYKGVSPKGDLWAVKRIALMSNDFQTEVRTMASLRHEHVVRLLGFCLHHNVESGQQEQILVYEFVPNGDLKFHIHDSKTPLTLKQRLQLAVGAAEGVAYLHSFATPIVHRDLKPGNILVGEHNQAKIADFGLLKMLTHAEGDGAHDRTRVAGTPGYLDPDYNRTQVVSEKSDVYSFGVVLLELLTRQKAAVEGTDSHISDWAARKVQVYELGELKDAGLEAPDEVVVELADIALDCLKMPASRRPNMKDVARRLQNLLSLYCSDGDHSAAVEPSLRMGGGVRGEGGSTDTFGRSEWSEAMSGTSAASKSLVHSLSEKWRMIE